MEQPASRNASSIDTVGKHALGYDIAQVDAFLAKAHEAYEQGNEALQSLDIDNVSFNICKNGYAIDQVDAALARLQKAVIERSCVWKVQHEGKQAWHKENLDLYYAISNVARRHAGERFESGIKKKPSYDYRQVDRLVDDLVTKMGSLLEPESIDDRRSRHVKELTPELLAKMVFTQRKGKHGYNERQVDYYLGVCAQLLMRIEAYNSLEEENAHSGVHATSDGEQSLPLRLNNAHDAAIADQQVTSLFAADTLARQQLNQPSYNAAFDDIHRKEQEIFAQDNFEQDNFAHRDDLEEESSEHSGFERDNFTQDKAVHDSFMPDSQTSTLTQDEYPVHYDHTDQSEAVDFERETDPLAKTAVFEPFFDTPNEDLQTPSTVENTEKEVQSFAGESSSNAISTSSLEEDSSNNSLAALARMAEGLHSISPSEDASFSPIMPSLKPLTVQPLIDESLANTEGNSLFAENVPSDSSLPAFELNNDFSATDSFSDADDRTGEFDQTTLADDTGEFREPLQ